MSLIADFPGIPESSLTTKWSDLVQAALAFKEVAAADNGLLAWQQTKELVRAYNEFLGGLFGYMILMWRVAHGKTPNPRVFACTYGDKVNQLRELTGGKDGPFYVFCRLAKPPLRNAISHGRIALDAEKQVVRYVDGKDIKIEFEMQLVEFAALAAAGSHLVMPYLAAIGAIVAMEQGGTVVRSVMPPVLVRLWEHDVERSGLYRCN